MTPNELMHFGAGLLTTYADLEASAIRNGLGKVCAFCNETVLDAYRMPRDQGYLCWRCYRERCQDRSGL